MPQTVYLAGFVALCFILHFFDITGVHAGSGDALRTQTGAQGVQVAGRTRRVESQTHDAVARSVLIDRSDGVTNFSVDFSEGVAAEVFTLGNPYRVIVDMPNVRFDFPAGAERESKGLVKNFRYGLFAPGKSRIVIDTSGPVVIRRADMTRLSSGGIRLSMRLAPTDPGSFGQGTGAKRAQSGSPASRSALSERRSPPPKSANRLVVVDPGHGGIDPGTLGAGNIYEKKIVLEVALRLRKILKSKYKYPVVMTRSKDVFVSLSKRIETSREAGAALFVSLHADAIADTDFAQSVRGATVYTLSDKASDEQSRLKAIKENSADALAGLSSDDGAQADGQVRDILFDLMRRETANFSADFSNVLVGKLKSAISLSRDPQKSAAFKVLKQVHAPSVLVELGYLSNAEDEKLMTTKAWQAKAATSIAAAIDAYFKKRAARRRR